MEVSDSRFRLEYFDDFVWETHGDHATLADALFAREEAFMQDNIEGITYEYRVVEYRIHTLS